jgi:hypothetical protein
VLVAQWIRSARTEQVLVPAMAASDSSLSRRVARLLAEPAGGGRSRSAAAAVLAFACVVLLALAAPGFSAWRDQAPASAARASGIEEAVDLLDQELLALDRELADLAQAITRTQDTGPLAGRIQQLASRVQEVKRMRSALSAWTQDPSDLSLAQSLSRRTKP